MAIGEDQVWALAYHRKSAHLSLQQLSQGLDSAFISQTAMELSVTDTCVCTEALHHTGSKWKRAPEAGLSPAGTPVVPGHMLVLGQPILLSHKQNSGEWPHLQFISEQNPGPDFGDLQLGGWRGGSATLF